MIPCTFMETRASFFIYYFAIKKNPGNLTYRIELDFFIKLNGWRHSKMKNLQCSILFSSQELYLGVCLGAN